MKNKIVHFFVFVTSFGFANAPVAVTDNLCIAQFTYNVNIVVNDYDIDGDLDPSSIDLDPNTLGQQTTFGEFSVDSNGNLTSFPNNYSTFTYTISDFMGNVSNITTVYVVEIPNPQAYGYDYSATPIVSSVGGILSDYTINDITIGNASVFFTDSQGFDIDSGNIIIPSGTNAGTYLLSYSLVQSVVFGDGSYCSSGQSIGYVTFVVVDNLGTNTIKPNDYEVFPNPTHNTLNINSPTNILQLDLFDLNGRILFSNNPNNSNFIINLDSYTNGIYLLQVMTEKGISYQRIVKN